MKEFKDKVAVITGGGSGIGRSLAHAFAKRGMKIVLADINEEALNNVSQELKDIGTEVLSLVTDVSDPIQVDRLANASYDRFGKVNILCNNAGVSTWGPMQLLTVKDWNWVLGANLFGVIYGIKSFLGRMLSSRDACHIVNTASIAGLMPADSGPYTASKFAVVGISEQLKQQCFNTNVSVSVLCPGYVVTNIIKNMHKFKQNATGVFKPPPEMEAMTKPFMDLVEKMFYSGINPDEAAEMVIKAIENDIFYILTHPEFIPYIKTRFEKLQSDTSILSEILAKSVQDSKLPENDTLKIETYNHTSPAFSISFPNDWIQLKPVPTPLLKMVFLALKIPNYGLSIAISKKSQDMLLEDSTKKLVRYLKTNGNEIKINSSRQTQLKDGTPTYETEIEYMRAGTTKFKILCVSVFRDNKVIRVILSALATCYSEDLKNIAYSLKLK